ncbi:MAG TPA: LytTR family DNA-binding domain-containing protein [Longimicrobiales bacterium]
MMIRTLIVDDEPLARAGLRNRLRLHEDIDIVGECGDGAEAIERIELLEPDLVFLDIEMPGFGGFDVINRIDGDIPAVVFVTAYSEYALNAFRVDAVDYLLKPIDDAAFVAALERVRARLARRNGESAREDLEQMLRDYRDARAADGADRRYLARIFVREGERGFFIRTAEIDWVQTADNYLRIAVSGREHIIRATMQELEQKLDPHTFARIHRRTIVNLERVQEITMDFRGYHVVRMLDGTQHRISRTFKERLLGRAL